MKEVSYDPDIEKKVMDIFKNQLREGDNNSSIPITYQSNPKDLGLDSLDSLEIMLELEDEFKVPIPDKYADQMPTIGNIINYIQEHYDERNQSLVI